LRSYGSPHTLEAFRNDVPVVCYEDLAPWLDRITRGECDVLFAGHPIAFERTGGSTGGAKLIPYSADGLLDFQRAMLPWLSSAVRLHRVTGKGYFSISPATRRREYIGDVPVGLPDGAYLGRAAAAVLAQVTAVPFDVGLIEEVARWRTMTLRYLAAASDLELISVWSPTFLLQLLDELEEPAALWPRLKIVSCWASGASKPFADALGAQVPHAHLQPKGLLSTETVVTVPDAEDRPILTPFGFFEFERAGRLHLSHELVVGSTYEVVATTAGGLYRYRTGDLVRHEGQSLTGRAVLEFVGRGSLVSDLVGEKLSEPFVASCLASVSGFRLLVPDRDGRGYVVAVETGSSVDIEDIEARLCGNPQYAYARQLGQLRPLRLLAVRNLFARYAQAQVEHGVRLGDVKPSALRSECAWTARLGGEP
jgi:hypothetical protein